MHVFAPMTYFLVYECVRTHFNCLQALSTLAAEHCSLLRGYSSYMANILDHLEGFCNAQLQQVFAMFAALTARQPAAAAAAGGAGATSSAAGAAAAKIPCAFQSSA